MMTTHRFSPIRGVASLVLLAVSMLPALAQWEKQAPFPTAETLNDVHIIAPGQAIAVGDGGVILKTMDSGVTWQPLPSGTTANLRGLYFIDDFRGWAVGDEVLLTTNAGRTWQKGVRSGNLSTLNDIDMINAAQGFACGEGVLMQTGDGGHTWSPVPIPSTHSWNALKFFSLTEGFVAGGLGSILYTNDAGQNWAWVPTGTTRWLKSMQFLSRNVAYAAGGDAVLKTTDGGVTWNLQQIPRPTSVVGLFFRNPLLGWLAGENQAILRTQNGGQSCQVQNGGATGDSYNKYPLNRVAFWNENTGVAVGHTGNVFTTSNGGLNWRQRQSGSGTATYSSACIDAQRAWLGNADGEVLYTTDGGKFWNRVNLQPGTGHVTSIRFRNAQSGWLTTTSGAGNAWKSTDGGLTWANAGAPRFPAKAIDTFNDQTIIWVGSQAGGAPILRSTNGGGTWTYRRFTGSNNLNDVRFLDANTVWIAGDGWLIKSTNAGETYTTIIQNPQINFNNVSFSGLNHGWVTSSQGLMRTTNGGSTWNVVAAAPQGIRYVQAISPTTAWVTGDGFAARTTDGGATWGIEPLEADTTFVTGSWVNEYEGWAAGHRTSQSLENPYMSVFRRSVAPPAALSSISISPTLVVGGDRCTGTIILAKAAPEGGQTVQVSDNSSALHTPATVFIPAGQGVMDFPIRTEVVGAQALRTVTASFAGVTKTANVTITPGGLTSFRVEPAQVIGGESTTGTLTLSGPAPAGGRTITLTSSSSVIGVPPTVFIRESVSEIQFQISTSRYAGSPATRYVQARSGDVTRTASITVTATPTISTLTLSPSSVKGGQNSTGTVSLNAPAPAGGLVVELSDSSTAIDTPASVTVPAGARSATFVIQTQRVGSTATRQVFATLAGLTKSANLTLTP